MLPGLGLNKQSITSTPNRIDEDQECRFGSKADICSALADVRFTPESGHMRRKNGCLLWANSGHCTLGFKEVALPRVELLTQINTV